MARAKEFELEIDVTYEDDEDTAVMPLGAIRELLRQEMQASASMYRKREPIPRRPGATAKSR